MTRQLLARLAESFTDFCNHFGLPLFPWQREHFGEAVRRRDGRFVHRLAAVSVARGLGKTFGLKDVGLWRLITGPVRPVPQDIDCRALDKEGARVLLDAAKADIRDRPALQALVEIRADTILVPSTGSRMTIGTGEQVDARGRHPHVVLYDEAGWAPNDELFSTLLAGQASVADPFCLVASTVGPIGRGPLWAIKDLAEKQTAGVYWFHSSENLSPLVSAEFLARQRGLLPPSQFAREHENQWTSPESQLLTDEMIDACVDRTLEPVHRDPERDAFGGFDIGPKNDYSAGVIVSPGPDGRLELLHHRIWRPSPGRPLNLDTTVEAYIRAIAPRFARFFGYCDPFQAHSLIMRVRADGIRLKELPQTVSNTSKMGAALYAGISGGLVRLYPSPELREALQNCLAVTTEAGFRLGKGSNAKKIDAAVALSMALVAAQQVIRPRQVVDDDDGQPQTDGAWAEKFQRERADGYTEHLTDVAKTRGVWFPGD